LKTFRIAVAKIGGCVMPDVGRPVFQDDFRDFRVLELKSWWGIIPSSHWPAINELSSRLATSTSYLPATIA
jgi:hypothetical protein